MTEPVFLFRYDVFYKIPIQGGVTRVTVDAPDEETAKKLAEEKFLASELGKVVSWHIFDRIELRQTSEEPRENTLAAWAGIILKDREEP